MPSSHMTRWVGLAQPEARILEAFYRSSREFPDWPKALNYLSTLAPGLVVTLGAVATAPARNAGDLPARCEQSDRHGIVSCIHIAEANNLQLILSVSSRGDAPASISKELATTLMSLQPHLAEAYRLTRCNLRLVAMQLLSHTAFPALAVTADAKLVASNAAFGSRASGSTPFALTSDGRLIAETPRATIALRTQLRRFVEDGGPNEALSLEGDTVRCCPLRVRAVVPGLRHEPALLETLRETEPLALLEFNRSEAPAKIIHRDLNSP